MSSKQSIVRNFPLDGYVRVAGEVLTTPYHIYDGIMFLIGGTVHGGRALDLLSRDDLTPVLNGSGRTLAAVWVGDVTEPISGLIMNCKSRYSPCRAQSAGQDPGVRSS